MVNQAQRIADKIRGFTDTDLDYWAFRGRARREHCHALLAYPAMMVPEMQGELIDILLEFRPSARTIFDPFSGSGTVLGESMLRGLNFIGTDINPLAILCCEVKSDPFDEDYLRESFKSLKYNLNQSEFSYPMWDFIGVNKWFQPEIKDALSRIREAIRIQPAIWCRRFFWLAMAETVRKFCNSRPSTYKLHIKTEETMGFEGSPIDYFLEKIEINIRHKNNLWSELKHAELVEGNKLVSKAILKVSDILDIGSEFDDAADIIVTSPPYGDNATTVPYGQYSYLQLRWIDSDDISSPFDRELLSYQSSIDSASLGGSLRHWKEHQCRLESISPAICSAIAALQKIGKTGEKRLVSFCHDLYDSIIKVSTILKVDGYAMFTLGNRSINGYQVPLDRIVSDMLASQNMEEVILFERNIPSKRMAVRNNISNTMSTESILIVRKKK